jgi:hypothetical protein
MVVGLEGGKERLYYVEDGTEEKDTRNDRNIYTSA